MIKNAPVKIFIAYSRQDWVHLEELRKQFKPYELIDRIKVWYDGIIMPGGKWDDIIKSELGDAEIILLLVSPDSIASEYFYENEVQSAIQKHHEGLAHVVPVILRPCKWDITPLKDLQAVPKDGKPIVNWELKDDGYFDVVEKIDLLVEEVIWQRHVYQDESKMSLAVGEIEFLDTDGFKIKYAGELLHGKANGRGVGQVFGPDYYRYEGLYQNNLRHDADAFCTWKDGRTYKGSFQKDKITGYGETQWPNGHYYIGHQINGLKSGMGEHYQGERNWYKGEYHNDVRHGNGWVQEPNSGSKPYGYIEYSGSFWNGLKIGQGKMKYLDSHLILSYEGNFLDDIPHGEGICAFRGGGSFEGTFFHGWPKGRGKVVTPKQISAIGEFESFNFKDPRELLGKFEDEEQNVYEGEFQLAWDNRYSINEIRIYPFGNGKITLNNTDEIIGEFEARGYSGKYISTVNDFEIRGNWHGDSRMLVIGNCRIRVGEESYSFEELRIENTDLKYVLDCCWMITDLFQSMGNQKACFKEEVEGIGNRRNSIQTYVCNLKDFKFDGVALVDSQYDSNYPKIEFDKGHRLSDTPQQLAMKQHTSKTWLQRIFDK